MDISLINQVRSEKALLEKQEHMLKLREDQLLQVILLEIKKYIIHTLGAPKTRETQGGSN